MSFEVENTSFTRWWTHTKMIMILKNATSPVPRDSKDIARRHRRTTSRKTLLASVLLLLVIVLMLGTVEAQVELGYRDLLYPDRLLYAASEEPADEPDPLRMMRTMTKRATITVEGRDQQRFLTVFRASKRGHVEFGFPTPERRATGSLEILDVSRLSSHCCSAGIRMVAARHACSDSYLTLDRYGQMRACQISESGVVTPMRSHTHCVEGEKMHLCTQSPYFFLDPVERFRNSELTTADEADSPEKRYKIRFEQKRRPNSPYRSVYYVTVTTSTWEIKVRPQNGALRRATLDAAQRLWVRSLHTLFSKTITAYEKRRLKRNFLGHRSPCDIDPAVVRDYLIQSANSAVFKQLIDTGWRTSESADTLASSVAWGNMTSAQNDVFLNIVVRVVKFMLREALLRVSNLHCLSRTHWGRLSRVNKSRILENSLTNTWIQKRTEARNFVLESVNKWLDSRLTTFVIKEGG